MATLRVLLVEDDDGCARAVAEDVECSDIQLERAATMTAARAKLAAGSYDAVLLPLDVPGVAEGPVIQAIGRSRRGMLAIVLAGAGEATSTGAHGSHPGELVRAMLRARNPRADGRTIALGDTPFAALLEHARDVITLVDEEGRILFDSRSVSGVLGFAPGERVGESFERFLHPDDVPSIREQFQHLLRQPDEVLRAEYRVLHKDGSWRWGEAVGVNRLQDPAVRGIVANHRDVTERKLVEHELRQSEEKLRQAQKLEAVGRLAGGVAHDFNNVLTAIFGYTDLLLEQFSASDPRRGDIEEIRSSAERAAALTRQLLAFSRKQVMKPRVLDLNEVISGVQKLLGKLLGHEVQLELDLDPRLGRVRGDPGQLEQVLMNLAANARDAMPDGGTFRITTRNAHIDQGQPARTDLAAGEYALMLVHDSGRGVAHEIREHVFDPFFTTKDVGKGTGLGLATVYGIVRQLGGGIYLEGEPEQGTTFAVYLPRVSE